MRLQLAHLVSILQNSSVRLIPLAYGSVRGTLTNNKNKNGCISESKASVYKATLRELLQELPTLRAREDFVPPLSRLLLFSWRVCLLKLGLHEEFLLHVTIAWRQERPKEFTLLNGVDDRSLQIFDKPCMRTSREMTVTQRRKEGKRFVHTVYKDI